MAEDSKDSLMDKPPLGDLKNTAASYGKSLLNHTLGKVSDKVEDFTGKMSDYTDGEGSEVKGKDASEGAEAMAKDESPAKGTSGGALSGVKDKVKGAFTGGGGKGSKSQKFVNLVEWIDVGVPANIAYNQWTQFGDWTDFMKKVEQSEHDEEEGTVKFKGQVFLSHRTWAATIKEMVPDDRIIWKSTGEKGHLDGAVTFHEYGPRLTRICIVVEYYPQGFFEKTAQIWRAVGRRVRVEMKRYVRHVMTTTILDPDSAVGWRGEIRDEEIVRTHEEVVEQEEQEAQEAEGSEGDEEPNADVGEVEDDEEYEEDPGAEEDVEATDDGEYAEEPEAGEAVEDDEEGVEYEDDTDAEPSEETADEQEDEEADESAEAVEEPAGEVGEEAPAEEEEAPGEAAAEDTEPEKPKRKRK